MITSISVENFKGVGERVTVPLKPITLLFGPNSAGKSTIVHAVQYAHEVLDRRNLDADRTSIGGPFVDLGGFRNFVHNRDTGQAVTLSFEMRRTDPDAFLVEPVGQWQAYEGVAGPVTQLMTRVKSARVEFSVRWSSWRECAYVSSYSVWLDGEPVATIEADADKRGARLTRFNLRHPVLAPGVYDNNDELETIAHIWQSGQLLVPGEEDSRVLALRGTDALPDIEADEELSFDEFEGVDADELGPLGATRILAAANLLSWMLVGPARRLRNELRSMIYLGPLRQTPPRNFEPPKSKDPGRWATGMAAWDILKTADVDIYREVGKWVSHLPLGYDLIRRNLVEIDTHGDVISFIDAAVARGLDNDERAWPALRKMIDELPSKKQLMLHDRSSGIDVEPEDVGEGVSQLVPVIVAVLSASALITIEQPELHVHPRLQVALGDLLVNRINKGREGPLATTLLIETHSEHLLLRLLRRIRETSEGTLPPGIDPLTPSELAVLYIEPDQTGTRVKELRVSAEGDFLDKWPDGFFEERAEELF